MSKSILVAMDFSDTTGEIVARAAELARGAGRKLWLVHVGAPEPDWFGHQLVRKVVPRDEVPPELVEDQRRLDEAVARLRAEGLEAEARLVRGPAVDSLLEEARHLDPEIIVLGSHGHSPLYRALVGSVSEGVLRGTHCPVLIVPSPKPSDAKPDRRRG